MYSPNALQLPPTLFPLPLAEVELAEAVEEAVAMAQSEARQVSILIPPPPHPYHPLSPTIHPIPTHPLAMAQSESRQASKLNTP